MPKRRRATENIVVDVSDAAALKVSLVDFGGVVDAAKVGGFQSTVVGTYGCVSVCTCAHVCKSACVCMFVHVLTCTCRYVNNLLLNAALYKPSLIPKRKRRTFPLLAIQSPCGAVRSMAAEWIFGLDLWIFATAHAGAPLILPGYPCRYMAPEQYRGSGGGGVVMGWPPRINVASGCGMGMGFLKREHPHVSTPKQSRRGGGTTTFSQRLDAKSQ